jgi:hypothetical protein
LVKKQKSQALDLQKSIIETEKNMVEHNLKVKERAYEDEQRKYEDIVREKEKYFHEQDKILANQEYKQEKYVSNEEKTLWLRKMRKEIDLWNLEVENKKITMFDEQLKQLEAQADVERDKTELIERQLDLEKQKIILAQVEQEKNVKIFKDGKFQWTYDPRKYKEENERLVDMELEFEKFKKDQTLKTQKEKLDNEKKNWDEENYNLKIALDDKKRVLDDERRTFEIHYENVDLMASNSLNNLRTKYNENWTLIIGDLVTKADQAETQYKRLLGYTSGASSLPSGGSGSASSNVSNVSKSLSPAEQAKNNTTLVQNGISPYVPGEKSAAQKRFEKGSADGLESGIVTSTGLHMLHATKSKPEYVLTDPQMKNAINLMIGKTQIPNVNTPNVPNMRNNNVNNSKGDVNYNITIDKVVSSDLTTFINSMKRYIRS